MRLFRIYLSLGVILISLSGFLLHKSYLINAGKSVGPFYISKTTLKELRSQLGRGQLETRTWHAPYCSTRIDYKVLSYNDKGLVFTFYTERLTNRSTFWSIDLQKNCDAFTSERLGVGSTRAEVIKSYGKFKSDRDSVKMLSYASGILFEFEKSTKFLMGDTVTSVMVFDPN